MHKCSAETQTSDGFNFVCLKKLGILCYNIILS